MGTAPSSHVSYIDEDREQVGSIVRKPVRRGFGSTHIAYDPAKPTGLKHGRGTFTHFAKTSYGEFKAHCSPLTIAEHKESLLHRYMTFKDKLDVCMDDRDIREATDSVADMDKIIQRPVVEVSAKERRGAINQAQYKINSNKRWVTDTFMPLAVDFERVLDELEFSIHAEREMLNKQKAVAQKMLARDTAAMERFKVWQAKWKASSADRADHQRKKMLEKRAEKNAKRQGYPDVPPLVAGGGSRSRHRRFDVY